MATSLPSALLQSLEHVPGFDRAAFEQVHASGEQVTSIRFNPAKLRQIAPLHTPASIFPGAQPIPWTQHGFYLPQRPFFTFDPFLHGGLYYVQEASSMFLEQALQQTVDTTADLKVLDLCAAPGGKSTHLQSLLSPGSLLVSNEVIKSRAAILEENMIKWGAANVIVTSNDPQDFARLPHYFDVMVIDAPCSGSGLFRREPEAVREWSEHAVQLCSQRQQRILADSYPALKENGVLIYATCSYSTAEDEQLLDWLMNEFELQSLPLNTSSDPNIVTVQSAQHKAYGYRFFPHSIKGEGFFIACFRKKDGGEHHGAVPKKTPVQKLSKKEDVFVRPWLKPDAAVQLWKQGDNILAFPANLEQELLKVSDKLYIRHAGITAGKLAASDLIPDHSLALSGLTAAGIVGISLKKEEALQYLRKEQVMIASPQTGWTLIQYEGIALGWVKILANRMNNYYPSAWRILKSGNN